MDESQKRTLILAVVAIVVILILAYFFCIFCFVTTAMGIANSCDFGPYWCCVAFPPFNETDGGDDEEEEGDEPEEIPVICEDLDDKLEASIPAYLLDGRFACITAGMNWFEESAMVGCRDPFIPGRIDCTGIVVHPEWATFTQACITAGGQPVCNRKFAGCLCNPTGAYECGWSWTYTGGSRCSGTCNAGGACTEVEGYCLCKDGERIVCDEYLMGGELECVGQCTDEAEWCGLALDTDECKCQWML